MTNASQVDVSAASDFGIAITRAPSVRASALFSAAPPRIVGVQNSISMSALASAADAPGGRCALYLRPVHVLAPDAARDAAALVESDDTLSEAACDILLDAAQEEESRWGGLHATLCSFAPESAGAGEPPIHAQPCAPLLSVLAATLREHSADAGRTKGPAAPAKDASVAWRLTSLKGWLVTRGGLVLVLLPEDSPGLLALCEALAASGVVRPRGIGDLHVTLGRASALAAALASHGATLRLPAAGTIAPAPEALVRRFTQSARWQLAVARCETAAPRKLRTDSVPLAVDLMWPAGVVGRALGAAGGAGSEEKDVGAEREAAASAAAAPATKELPPPRACGLKPLRRRLLPCGAVLVLSAGSVLDFVGDAMVNAANEGCVGGFGVDGAVNEAGGVELKMARKELGGCATGDAKVTPSFAHADHTRLIIHAVGPVFRINRLRDGIEPGSTAAAEVLAAREPLLTRAYASSMQRAREHGVKTLAFSLLSAGVFRGEKPLREVVRLGASAIADHAYEGLAEVHMVAYTEEEQAELLELPWPEGV